MPRRKEARRPGRLRRAVERIVLGAVMGFAAYLVERRLQRALARTAPPRAESNDTAHIH